MKINQHITLNDHASNYIVIIQQKSILHMLARKKNKPDICESNNIKGENFPLENNQSSANQQSISNVLRQKIKISLLILVQIQRMKTKVKTKLKNSLKHPMKTGVTLLQIPQIQTSGRSYFHSHFIHLAMMVDCVSYDQTMRKEIIFGDLKR